jgi:3-hydroxyacyl-CoA dehydrogenase
LEKDVAKNKITEQEKIETQRRISTTTSLKELAKADFIIEVCAKVPDSLTFKRLLKKT